MSGIESGVKLPVSKAPDIALGVDIGGTTIKFGVIDLSNFKTLFEHSLPTPQQGSQDLARLIAGEVREICKAFPKLTHVGVGVPGAMNRDRTVARYPPNLIGWKEEPFKKYLEEALPGFVIELDNDAKVATLAEARLGAGHGLDFFIMVTLGTGVGGGIFAEGKIFRGAMGGAGEIGMVSVKYDEPLVLTSSPGCLEGYVGQKFLSFRTLEKLRSSDRESVLRQFLQSGEIEPKDISLAASQGDSFAIEVLSEAGMILGVALANVAKLLDITVFVVGGGVAEAGDLILGPAEKALKANAMPNQRADARIVKAALGNRAGILGAALLVAEWAK